MQAAKPPSVQGHESREEEEEAEAEFGEEDLFHQQVESRGLLSHLVGLCT